MHIKKLVGCPFVRWLGHHVEQAVKMRFFETDKRGQVLTKLCVWPGLLGLFFLVRWKRGSGGCLAEVVSELYVALRLA